MCISICNGFITYPPIISLLYKTTTSGHNDGNGSLYPNVTIYPFFSILQCVKLHKSRAAVGKTGLNLIIHTCKLWIHLTLV